MDKELVTQAIEINVLSTEKNVSHQLDRFVDKKLLPVNEYRYIRHADLSFDNLLTWQEGLASVLFLVTGLPHHSGSRIIFQQDIWFNTCSQHRRNAVNHVCKRHVNRKICSYQRFSQGALSQIPVWWQVKLQHLKSIPIPVWNQGMGDGRWLFCSQILIIISSSRP